jgi:hypothetical protein
VYNVWSVAILRLLFILLCFYSGLVCAKELVSRDPTEPLRLEEDTLGKKNESEIDSSLLLEAIFISGEDKFAIINNKLIKIGDVIGTSIVKAIDSYHVTLVGETGETVLELFGRPIKEPVK